MSEGSGDAELIIAARTGDQRAYAELYRRHAHSAQRFARSLAGRSADAEDLVADAFARVLAAMKSGNGPDEAFRPYLLSAVRNAFYDHTRRTAREQPVEELTPFAPEIPFIDSAAAADERRLIARAFRELPERWQVVLWHTEVEGERPAEVAPLLGISANAVAALAYRAREGLRERYLQAHVGSAVDEDCRPTVARLAAYTRNKLSPADTERVRIHLAGCGRCRLLVEDLADVNSRLGALLSPILLIGAGAAYAAGSAGAGGAAVGVAAGSAAAGSAAAGGGVAAGGASVVARLVRRRDAQIAGAAAAAATIVALVLPFVTNAAPAPAEPGDPLAAPSVSASGAGSTASPDPTSSSAESPAPAPPPAGVTATLEPVGSLVRGGPGTLVLTVGISASVDIFGLDALTATFTLPIGVTLRSGDAGDGWTCGGIGTIVCTRAILAVGEITRAYVGVLVAAEAAEGVPSVSLTGLGPDPSTVLSSHGVTSAGLGAVWAATRPATVLVVGNSLLSCGLLDLACIAARGGSTLGAVDNDAYRMDPFAELLAPLGAPLGATVSSAQLSRGGEVAWAGLYWAGTGPAPAMPTAYLRSPGGGGYQALAASRVHQASAPWLGRSAYQASVDVTALVRAAPAQGTWHVAVPGSAFAAGVGAFGGWALVVVVDGGGPARTVAVFDGLVPVEGSAAWMSTLQGLGAGSATVGLVGWDGDRGRGGDTVALNGTTIGASGAGGIAISAADGTPAGWNTFGTDARVLNGSASGANPVLTATGGDDGWLLGVFAAATGP